MRGQNPVGWLKPRNPKHKKPCITKTKRDSSCTKGKLLSNHSIINTKHKEREIETSCPTTRTRESETERESTTAKQKQTHKAVQHHDKKIIQKEREKEKERERKRERESKKEIK